MRIVFMGTPDFAVPCLEALVNHGYEVAAVVTQPDRPKGRNRELSSSPVKVAAIRLGIPVLQPEKIRAEEALVQLESLGPDLLITAAYGQILPKRLLELPKMGCINVHASLLPRWRGGAPIHRSIIEGDDASGVTVMRMVQALDAGAMLSQVVVPIEEHDTVGSLHDKLAAAGSELLIETLPFILDGSIADIPQDEQDVTYAPNLTREDEKIDWSKGAKTIFNQVRGLNPWPVAYTTFHGQVFKIWLTQVLQETGREQVPGTVIRRDNEQLWVQTGEGIIRITEIQPAGKKRMAISEFLRGSNIQIGDQFES